MNSFEEGALQEALQRAESLHARPAANDWEAVKNQSNAEAIEAFVDNADVVSHLAEYPTVETVPQASQMIAGVEVSVRPDAVFSSGDGHLAMLKLRMSKSRDTPPDQGRYVAAMMYEYVDELGLGGSPIRSRCVAFDVFNGAAYEAPRTYKRLIRDVEAACAGIAVLWPTI